MDKKTDDVETQVVGSRWQNFMLFAILGGASSWLATSLCWMELPIFQRYFGLKLSNRLELGYNLGTIPAGLYVLVRAWCRRSEDESNGSSIWGLLAIQALAICLLCLAVPGSNIFCQSLLVLTQVLGGTAGYMAQFVAVPYLMRFENELVGAFWTGDSATSVIAALLALVQRPDDQSPVFGLLTYMLLCGPPILIASCIAFYCIQRNGIGMLETREAVLVRVHSDDHIALESTLKCASKKEDLIEEVDGEETFECPDAPRIRLLSETYTNQAQEIDKTLCRHTDKSTTRWYLQSITWRLAFVVFWSQYADWGIGDGIFPYACANRGRAFVERCEMWSNELSLAAQFAGIALASKIPIRPKRNLGSILWAPTALYTICFALLISLFWIGHQYQPRALHFFFDDRTVVLIMGILRFLGPFTRTIVPRLIQPLYPQADHEVLPLFFGILGILGNVLGSATATLMIQVRYSGGRF